MPHSPRPDQMDLAASSKRPKLSSSSTAAAGGNQHHILLLREGKEEVEEEEQQNLLPGLPDHLAQLCLALVPPPLLYSVCRSWRRLLYSPSFPPFLALYALLSSSDSDSDSDNDSDIAFYCFDPIAAVWSPLPPPPPHPRLLLHHPSFIARSLPVQSVAAAGHLVLLAASTPALLPALPRPLVFHPASARWRLGPPFPCPRRWCAAGTAAGVVYLASGVGPEYNADVSHSAARWDPRLGPSASAAWEPVAPLRHGGRFSREAVEAVATRGKLCMVNLRGRGAKEGIVYNVRSDRWEDMPPALLAGWTGPAASADDDGSSIYVVDEVRGALRGYDWDGERWRVVVPESEQLKGAVQMAAGGGRVCVVNRGGSAVVVVDVAARPGRMWVVEPPRGKRVVALHVLPRMTRAES
ncbi:F-box/kelch-repeat protein SKIP25 [Elaeis guineensis]|uniref:F-box/kelch-repeat protein SKIP25 n=1 Tax=Elaeis guineensis var. tenera TaxID=51953 RepID=A0A6I9SB86_ELAGV|nr:F-box/kelch-repeat protein SKIP25 [Elaeis guineensis]